MSKSRWGERGPGHLRTDGKGRPKAEPGSHNRRARRAAKAQAKQPALFNEPTPEDLLWQSLLAAQKRDRARREANPAPFDQLAYDAEYHGDPWPEHIPMAACITSALRAARRYCRLGPRDFTRASERLANVVAFEGSEHLTCDTGKLKKREQAQKRMQVAALGRALGLGSCVPGGIKFCGIWLETKDGETSMRVLVPKASVEAAE